MGEHQQKCVCGCSHVPDAGACREFTPGKNKMFCVYCDHGKGCHPGKGPYANGPLGVVFIGLDKASLAGDRTVAFAIKKRDTRKRHKSRKVGRQHEQ